MAKGFKKGGGDANPLNFKVVGGTTQPANPKENTIWVNTSTKITGYVFSATEPVVSDGFLWFPTGTTSPVPFNALKRNALQVYPKGVKQRISGAWVDLAAKTYQNGWIDWFVYLFNNGVVDGVSWSGSGGGGATIVTTGTELKMDCPSESGETNYTASLTQNETFPTNGATKLKIHFTRLSAANGNSTNYPLSISINGGSSEAKQYTDIDLDDLVDNTLEIDVSGISAVKLRFQSHLWKSLESTCYLTIDRIWFEK